MRHFIIVAIVFGALSCSACVKEYKDLWPVWEITSIVGSSIGLAPRGQFYVDGTRSTVRVMPLHRQFYLDNARPVLWFEQYGRIVGFTTRSPRIQSATWKDTIPPSPNFLSRFCGDRLQILIIPSTPPPSLLHSNKPTARCGCFGRSRLESNSQCSISSYVSNDTHCHQWSG